MNSSVVDSDGRKEREIRSRRTNALEVLGIVCAVLFVVWPFCFGWGVLGHASWVAPVGKGLLTAAFLWAVLGSPWWHRDSAESLGLGSPGRLLRLLREGRGVERWRVAFVFAAVAGGLLWIGLADWPDAAKILRLPKPLRIPPDSAGAWAAVILVSASAAALLSTCVIRYDNFGSAFGLALKVSAGFLAYAILAAWLVRGDKAFAKFALHSHALDIAAHTFWGLIQQLVFTGYIATRMRKAFAPAASRPVPRSAGKQLVVAALGGLGAAAALGPAAWLALREMRDAPDSSLLLAGCAAFAFPLGAVWTHFLIRDPRRMAVAMLSGAFFGLIHIDSYGLVFVTGILGTTFAYAAMEDRFRNLAAFAFVHGLVGATFAKLFGGKGFLKITISVGPWSVRNPTAADLIVPILALLGYALVALWVARKMKAQPVADSPPAPETHDGAGSGDTPRVSS